MSVPGSDGDRSAESEPIVCATCGRQTATGEETTARLTWSQDLSGPAVKWTCDRCSREHVRSIEGKLDPDWW